MDWTWFYSNGSGSAAVTWAAIIQAAFTVILVVVTACYVKHTSKAVNEAARTAQANAELAKWTEVTQVAAFEPLVFPVRVRYRHARAASAFGDPEVEESIEVTVVNLGQGAALSLEVTPCVFNDMNATTHSVAPLLARESRTINAKPSTSIAQALAEKSPRLSRADQLEFLLRIAYRNVFGREQEVSQLFFALEPADDGSLEGDTIDSPTVRGNAVWTEVETRTLQHTNERQGEAKKRKFRWVWMHWRR